MYRDSEEDEVLDFVSKPRSHYELVEEFHSVGVLFERLLELERKGEVCKEFSSDGVVWKK